jgi:hypothetical protein
MAAASATAASTPTATTVTSAATTTAAVSTAAATTTRGAFGLRASFIHDEISSTEILSVQGIDGAIRVFVIADFDEGKASRLSGKTIANQIDGGGSYADLGEPLIELFLGG